MKLSVIIPCYNKSSYLIEMIKSIQCQTFTDWELILVDDGSEEEQFEQIANYVSCDHRIQLVKRNRLPKNGDTCRNIGMGLAKGEYLIIFDSDDLVSKTCFEKRVEFMDLYPECDYASFPSCSFIEGTTDYRPRKFDNQVSDVLGCLLSADYPFAVWANIYRKSSLNKICWDENVYLYQDFDFMVQCELKGLKHYWADSSEGADYYYRVFGDGNSVCQTVITEQKVNSTNYLFKKIVQQIRKLDDGKRLKKLFFRFYVIYFEQMMLSYNELFVDSFLEMVGQTYPEKILLFKKITDWRERHKGSSHLIYAQMYLKLYASFKEPSHRLYVIHEIGKWFLNK